MDTSNENKVIADRLREAATLLEQQDANRFRVAAYRKAADTLESLQQDVGSLLRTEGFQGLTSLPGIGPQIAGAVSEMVRTGYWPQLERLRGRLDPVRQLGKIPGIGPRLAQRVVDELHVDTLEGLELAVYDGRLDRLPGFGSRRVAMVRAALAEMLGRGRARSGPAIQAEPPVGIVLDADREYRQKAAANKLRLIAPKRFNPKNEAWLPILHTERDLWQFTLLYSNTALAHRLGRTRDWVVVYFHDDSRSEGQRTVVTETQGPLKGKRVVRGRENDCAEHYRLLWSEPSDAA
jgi:putative hydrolase